MSPNDADGMANSVDPDQTAPLGAVWSGSALFAQAYLSENLGSLRYSRALNLFLITNVKDTVPWPAPNFCQSRRHREASECYHTDSTVSESQTPS